MQLRQRLSQGPRRQRTQHTGVRAYEAHLLTCVVRLGSRPEWVSMHRAAHVCDVFRIFS